MRELGVPSDGITSVKLSRMPLATEGEATPGPDDWNPYDELEDRRELREFERELNRGRRRDRHSARQPDRQERDMLDDLIRNTSLL